MKCSMCGEQIKYGVHYFITKKSVLCKSCGVEHKKMIKHMAEVKNIKGKELNARDMERH